MDVSNKSINSGYDYRKSSPLIYFGEWLNQAENNFSFGVNEKGLVKFKKFISLFIDIYNLYQKDYGRIKKIDKLGDNFSVKSFDMLRPSAYSTTKILKLVGDDPNSLFRTLEEITLTSFSRGKKFSAVGTFRGASIVGDTREIRVNAEDNVIRGYIDLFQKYQLLYNFLEIISEKKFVLCETNGNKIIFQLCYKSNNSKQGIKINEVDGINLMLQGNDKYNNNYRMTIFISCTTGEIDYDRCSLIINNARILIADDIYRNTLESIKVQNSYFQIKDFEFSAFESCRNTYKAHDEIVTQQEKRQNHVISYINEIKEDMNRVSPDAPRVTLIEYINYIYNAYEEFIAGFNELSQISDVDLVLNNDISYEESDGHRKLVICLKKDEKVSRINVNGTWKDVVSEVYTRKLVIEKTNGNLTASSVSEISKAKAIVNNDGSINYVLQDDCAPVVTQLDVLRPILDRYLGFFKFYYPWIDFINKTKDCHEPVVIGNKCFTFNFQFAGGLIKNLVGLHITISDLGDDDKNTTEIYLNIDHKKGISVEYESSGIMFSEAEYGTFTDKELIDTILNDIHIPVAANGYIGEEVIKGYMKKYNIL